MQPARLVLENVFGECLGVPALTAPQWRYRMEEHGLRRRPKLCWRQIDMKVKRLWAVLMALLAVTLVVAPMAMAQSEDKPAEKKVEKAEKPKKAAPSGPTLDGRLKKLNEALILFCKNNNSMAPVKIKQLARLLKEEKKGLINPETGKAILMNAKMKKVRENQIEKPEEFITFYADAPTEGKGRAALFGDGTIKYMKEKAFKTALKKSVPRLMTRDEREERRGPRERHRDE